MNPEEHGGDLRGMAAISGREPGALLDFSVNIRPEGPPEFLFAAMLRARATLSAYPSPHAEEALEAAAHHHGIPAARFLFGNGSNELIHACARMLKKRGVPAVCIVEPAFSEYALACRRAGLELRHVWGGLARAKGSGPANEDGGLARLLASAPSGAAVFLANPGNPLGIFRNPDEYLACMRRRPDLLWIVDEAFVEYAGPEADCSLVRRAPENSLVLRSLTKFYAVPGLRIGYLAAAPELIAALRAEIPIWNLNAFALAAAVAALTDRSGFAERCRRENAARRDDLARRLAALRGAEVFPSAANYLLFRLPKAPRDLRELLLRRFGIALRACANYHGLEDGTWFRAAVRLPEEHLRLASALRAVLSGRASVRPAPAGAAVPALMLQGTTSDAGKSVLAAAYCRIFLQDGYSVCPFKAQNMALNSGVSPAGEEMGRAQLLQAQAARVTPDARMNPILIKPHGGGMAQLVVRGVSTGHMPILEYGSKTDELWRTVTRAYDELAHGRDLMVLEGAGGAGEVNLKKHDIVNMRMARYAGARVLLVGDIERGGVYASLLGTWMTFTDAERRQLLGYIVNRFRGTPSVLGPAHDYLLEHTGLPVLGVIPYLSDLVLPKEDTASLSRQENGAAAGPETLDIAVLMLSGISNFTDFQPFETEPGLRLRYIRSLQDWGAPHVVMLPGSKSVVRGLEELRESGLADKLLAHARGGGWVFGICGGLQMLGRAVLDPEAVESSRPEAPGLGLMDLRSTFAAKKTLIRVERAQTPLGLASGGYEIHHGVTENGPEALPLFRRHDASGADRGICGYVTGRCWATYLHGIFDDDAFRHAWIEHVRASLGLPAMSGQAGVYSLEKALDRLADTVREHCDMQSIYRALGLK